MSPHFATSACSLTKQDRTSQLIGRWIACPVCIVVHIWIAPFRHLQTSLLITPLHATLSFCATPAKHGNSISAEWGSLRYLTLTTICSMFQPERTSVRQPINSTVDCLLRAHLLPGTGRRQCTIYAIRYTLYATPRPGCVSRSGPRPGRTGGCCYLLSGPRTAQSGILLCSNCSGGAI